ncbi:MAG: sensor histidine kinase [Candidatus Xenobia bacterium]
MRPQESSELPGHLAAGMAHELNNPLGTILLNAELLLEEALSDDAREAAERILQAARACKGTVEALLGYARARGPSRVDLLQVAEDARRFNQVELSRAEVIARVHGPSVQVVAHRGHLLGALTNLLLNARDALAARPGPRTVEMEVGTDGTLRIRDNGPGIPPEVLAHLFEPYATGKASGTGLGLYVSRELVRQSGGDIGCESTPQGTTFTIRLRTDE